MSIFHLPKVLRCNKLYKFVHPVVKRNTAGSTAGFLHLSSDDLQILQLERKQNSFLKFCRKKVL